MGRGGLTVRASRRFAHFAGGRADGSWESRLRAYLHPSLLIVDDFCLRELSPQQEDDTFALVGERHRRSSMIIASNRTPQDWYSLFPNPVLAEGVLARLINRSHHLLLEGHSHRPLLRPDRPQPLAKEGDSQ